MKRMAREVDAHEKGLKVSKTKKARSKRNT